MNIFNLFKTNRDRVQYKLDEIIMDGLTKEEMIKNRQEIIDEFDGLLAHTQLYHDQMNLANEELRKNNELLRQLCKGES